MKKLFSSGCFFVASAAVLLSSLAAQADDRFSLVIGSHDLLTVANDKGEARAHLPLPTISQTVTVDATSFQISYGRDANNLLTAIVAPNPSQPQDLHFSVLGKSVDADKEAVVTLTFSKSLSSVRIDPGYVGDVQVNAKMMRRDSAGNWQMQHAPLLAYSPTETPTAQSSLGDATKTISTDPAAPLAPAAPADSHVPASTSGARAAVVAAKSTTTAPVPVPQTPVAANQAANSFDPGESGDGHVSDHSPLPMQVNAASQMPFTATATPGPSTVSVVGTEVDPKQHSLYWSEPVTSPNGVAPSVGINQMKLVEVNGPVSVTVPGAENRDGVDGMILPSGSVVSTSGGSSAAVFMGGVNSVRLLPDTEIRITQEMSGSLRKTVVSLRQGTVFNRVGHRDGEAQNFQVESAEGVAVAKGTEFADSVANGHHFVFVVKGVVAMIMNGIQTGLLTSVPNNVASGAMPPSSDGNRILFGILTALQPFQPYLQKVVADINNGSATPAELGYYDSLKNTFSVLVDDVYDPTHPNAFMGAFTSLSGYGDTNHSVLERPQDYATPNPFNQFNGLVLPSHESDSHPFSTPAVTPTFSGDLPHPPAS